MIGFQLGLLIFGALIAPIGAVFLLVVMISVIWRRGGWRPAFRYLGAVFLAALLAVLFVWVGATYFGPLLVNSPLVFDSAYALISGLFIALGLILVERERRSQTEREAGRSMSRLSRGVALVGIFLLVGFLSQTIFTFNALIDTESNSAEADRLLESIWAERREL
jgi:hypothetical protein